MRLLLVLLVLVLAAPSFAQGARTPRFGTAVASLTNTPQPLLRAVPSRILTFCVISGGAASEDVIFRGIGGTPVYTTVTVAAGALIARSLNATIPAAGLEVVTSSPAGDVTVECAYKVGP
jgi:hypothetical protein